MIRRRLEFAVVHPDAEGIPCAWLLNRHAHLAWRPDRPYEGFDAGAGGELGQVGVPVLESPGGRAALQVRSDQLDGFVRAVQRVWQPVQVSDDHIAALIAGVES